ncbi:MAG: glycerol-3-phosphate dehydrogenase/oxidase [Pirellulaceae bacterium]
MSSKTVLVLGAGINGVAIARELLLNRVAVCLVDRWDITGGTTAYSSRLIHGGLRYLEYGDFSLVRESLEERERLLQLAPQFVQPLQLFIPVERRASGFRAAARKFLGFSEARDARPVPRGLWLVRTGLLLYDLLARRSSLPHHRVHSLHDPSVPPVNRERFRWLASYYDAQIRFAERFVLAMLEDARRLSIEQSVALHVYTYCVAQKQGPVVTLQPGPEIVERQAQSTDNVAPLSFQPAAIINATGAWVDHTLAQLQVASSPLIGGTKGSHLFTRNRELREALKTNGVYAEASDGRPVFLLPFGSYSVIGTTDLPVETKPETVTIAEDELQYLLGAAHDVFPKVTLTRQDIDFHYSGVRPLPKVSASQPASVTRRHMLHVSDVPDVPLISIVGGKLTTCRSLAEEAAKLVLERLDMPVQRNSRDRVIPGGEKYPMSCESVAEQQARLANELKMTRSQVDAMWQLCGTRIASMAASETSGARPDDNADCLVDTDLPLVFVRRVMRDEWVRTLNDLVERRLMLLYWPSLTRACLQQLAMLMVEQGLLPADQVEPEIDRCLRRLKTHFGRTIADR